MQRRDIATRLGVVVLLALVVGAGATLTLAGDGGIPVGEPLTVDSHQPDAILATAPAETGELSVPADAGEKRVVIDTGHGNDLDRESIAPVVAALTDGGHAVSFYRGGRGSSLNETLRSADAFVVVSPQQAYTPSERAGLGAFVAGGGRVLLAGEPPSQGSALVALMGGQRSGQQATAPVTGLASSFGLAFGDGYVYDLETYANNYRNVYVTPTAEATALSGIENGTVHEATTVRGGTPILETTATAKVSNDRTAAAYPVAARAGNVVVLGDASVLDREWVRRTDNEAIVSGLLEFLVTGDKDAGVPAPASSDEAEPPTRPPRTPS